MGVLSMEIALTRGARSLRIYETAKVFALLTHMDQTLRTFFPLFQKRGRQMLFILIQVI